MKSRRFRIEQSEFVERERDDYGRSTYGKRQKDIGVKNDELRFWLKYRNDSAKGLRTKAQLVKR